MNSIQVKKVFKNIDEINNSEEYKELWNGFHFEKIREYDSSKIVKGFLTEGNEIYTIRKMTKGDDSGLQILKKISIHSSLDNHPFVIGKFENEELEFFEDMTFEKNNNNRKILADTIKKAGENYFVISI